MPRFDQRCRTCTWEDEILVPSGTHPPCPTCGGQTERVWRRATRVIGDEIPGGVWVENLGPVPQRFDSKQAIAQEAKRRGLQPMVRHVPVPGTDKSPHTTNWAVASAWQLEQAKILLERVGREPARSGPPETAVVHPQATEAMVAQVWEGME